MNISSRTLTLALLLLLVTNGASLYYWQHTSQIYSILSDFASPLFPIIPIIGIYGLLIALFVHRHPDSELRIHAEKLPPAIMTSGPICTFFAIVLTSIHGEPILAAVLSAAGSTLLALALAWVSELILLR
ncbi:MAG: hypothetical protein ABW148_16420 [Sedimenticola sp.]